MSTSDHSKIDEETMEKLQNSWQAPYAEATRNHLKEQNCYIFSLAMRHLLIPEELKLPPLISTYGLRNETLFRPELTCPCLSYYQVCH